MRPSPWDPRPSNDPGCPPPRSFASFTIYLYIAVQCIFSRISVTQSDPADCGGYVGLPLDNLSIQGQLQISFTIRTFYSSQPMRALIVSVFISFGILDVSAQSTVLFSNRVFGQIIAPIFGPQLEDNTLMLQGNGSDSSVFLPAQPGGPAYTGIKLEGAGYTAQLFAGVQGSWVPVATTTFLSGSGAGFVQPVSGVVLAGAPTGLPLSLQVRAWENRSLPGDSRSDILSWEQAIADSTVLRGYSLPFQVDPTISDKLLGLRSFNVAVPEPSSVILLSLAVAGFGVVAQRRIAKLMAP